MKTTTEIDNAIEVVADADDGHTNYPAMTYEQGVNEALRWVLDEIPDEEFSPICDNARRSRGTPAGT